MIIGFNALLRRGGVLCLIATPLCALIYDPNVIFPFISPKAFAFHLLVLCELALVSVLLLTDKLLRMQIIALAQSKIFKAYLIYFFFILISGLVAENPTLALWGSPERADGIYLKVFCIYSMAIGAVLIQRDHWKLIFMGIIFTGVILLLFQCSQYTRNIIRPGSLLNQPTFLSSFYIFAIASSMLLHALSEQLKFRVITLCLAIGLIAIFLIGIVISGTRSSLVAVLIAFATPYLWSLKKNAKFSSIGIGMTTAFFALLVTGLSIPFDGADAISRLVNISKNYASIASRIINVEISLSSMNPMQSGIKTLLFGWGWNNYNLAWDAAYLPSISRFDPAPFDKSHNTYIDVIVMTGGLGFFFFLNYLFTLLREVKNVVHRETKFSLSFLFTAIFVQYFFVFESLVDVLIFNIFVTYLIFEEIKEKLTC